MALSMYQASIPAVAQSLKNLSAILDKAAAHCEANKIDPAVLLGSRLYPDMFPLTRQVQIASDIAKGLAARLAGVEIPSFPDNETTFDELKARIARTVEFLNSFAPAQINGTEEKDITLSAGPNELKFKGASYLLSFALPNVYFHITTAYALLRHNGVVVGKKDFLGPL